MSDVIYPMIILICGGKGQGKDYFSDKWLSTYDAFEQCHSEYTIINERNITLKPWSHQYRDAFANVLKEEFIKHLGITMDEFVRNKEGYRKQLFNFAEHKRVGDRDRYTRILTDKYSNTPNSVCICISDFRQPEEYHHMKQHASQHDIITIRIADQTKSIDHLDPMETQLLSFRTDLVLVRK